jgi:AcrR family transcriptional regulator
MAARQSELTNGTARKRLIDAAYGLFGAHGVSQVGIDAILAKSGCAKASLYKHFDSKVALAIAFLDRRAALWTRGWFEKEVDRRGNTPEGRLIAVFDVFDEWFQRKDFAGCPFINVMLESDAAGPLHRAAASHLSDIRATLRALARDAGLAEPDRFARIWQMLMKGSIVSASEGNRNSAKEAKRGARLLLGGWQRVKQSSPR